MKEITDVVKIKVTGYRMIEVYYTYTDGTSDGPFIITENEYKLEIDTLRLHKEYNVPISELENFVKLAVDTYKEG